MPGCFPFSKRSADLQIGMAVVFCLWLFQWIAAAQTGFVSPPAAYRADRILVQPKAGIAPGALATFQSAQNVEVLNTFAALGNLQVVRVPAGETVPGLIERYVRSGLVKFAEPDYLVSANLTPNDPRFLDGTLWGLNNTGQSGGTPDADIDAPEGWDVRTSASNIVVAVLDTGVRATHEDLAANMWVSPLNGSHGFNAVDTNNPTLPNDDNGHGTFISGVLGGVGNNGKGIAGVAWRVQILSGKCLDSGGNGSESTIIACLEFARTNGARIINASFDGPGYSEAFSNAIARARDDGIIFVTSCGNNAANLDVTPRYPSCYNLDNIVSVAFTTRNDALGPVSNFGATNVDLAAPGAAIYSTWFISDNFYLGPLDGTSAAAPYVAGTFALMLAKYPAENYREIIARVLNGTDPLPALAGKCVTGGRLNLRKALSPPILLTATNAPGGGPIQLRVSAGPNRSCVLEASADLANWSPVVTNSTSASGTFDFVDPAATNLTHRFYRATSSL